MRMLALPKAAEVWSLTSLRDKLIKVGAKVVSHLLLQIRTRTLDGTLQPLFERWYPGLANDNDIATRQGAAV